jgi:hypothetical protein
MIVPAGSTISFRISSGDLRDRVPGFGIVTHVGRKSLKVYPTPVNVFRAPGGFIVASPTAADASA